MLVYPAYDNCFLITKAAMFLNLCLSLLSILSYDRTDKSGMPFVSFMDYMVFRHTVPAYSVILLCMCILYISRHEPNSLQLKTFNLIGVVLFFFIGIIALFNTFTYHLGTSAFCYVLFSILIAFLLSISYYLVINKMEKEPII